MGDLDIMVQNRDVGAAAEILQTIGFQPRKGKKAMFSPWHHAVTFDGRGTSIDLHRNLIQPGRAHLDMEPLWFRAGEYFEMEDEAVLHIAHMVRHELQVPLISFVYLSRRLTHVPRSRLVGRCQEIGLGRGVRACLDVLSTLADARGELRIYEKLQLVGWKQWREKVRLLDGPKELIGYVAVVAVEKLPWWRTGVWRGISPD